jgi:hypothetical protein
VRLEEWQKFIESQFLEDEPEPTKSEPQQAEPPKAEPSAKPEASLQGGAQATLPLEAPERKAASAPPAASVAEARVEPPAPGAETEPPLSPPPPTSAIPFTTPPVTRPADSTGTSSSIAPATTPALEGKPAVPPEPETKPMAASAAAATPAGTSAGDPAAPPTIPAARFGPLPDADADIPSFERYLPSFRKEIEGGVRHEASGVREKPSELRPDALHPAPDTRHPTPIVTPTRRTPRTRARHARNVRPENVPSGLSAAELWATVPKHVQTLLALERMEQEKETAQHSYKRPFQEKRQELIARLLDPILSLEDTARLLNVCPTTVRRYTNRGILTYYRKEPERSTKSVDVEKETRQRRFRLSDILAFLETQQTAIEADRRAERNTTGDVSPASLSDTGQE